MEQFGSDTETRAPSAFRVVCRPAPCYDASELLGFHSHLWYLRPSFPLQATDFHHGNYASTEHFTVANNKLKFSPPRTSSSVTKSESGVLHHTTQADNKCVEQRQTYETVEDVSLPSVFCAEESLYQVEDTKKISSSNTTCPVCYKVFGRPTTLRVHMRIHRGEKPFQCSYCGKSFSQSGNLTTHIRVHTGEKPFSCKVCGKQFSQSSARKGHMRIHLREKKE